MIALVGFMGAGKTSVGRALADRLDLLFVDVDETIERKTNETIGALFRAHGEPGLRAIESEVVAKLLGGPNSVVALGGGSVEDPRCRERLRDATVIYLDVDVKEALGRIEGGDAGRPMLDVHDPETLHRRRRPLYESVADVTVSTDGRGVDEVVEEIVVALERLDSQPA